MSNQETNPPKVFISYSHDSPEHKEQVLALSDRLRDEKIDCIIDQYEEFSPPEGWPRWTEKQIREADFVLMVCTETFYRRFMGEETQGLGRGARWEGNTIYQLLYNDGTSSTKFIPVLLGSGKPEHIPTALQGIHHYCLNTEEGYDDLYRKLTNQPSTPKNELGLRRTLPPRQRRQNFPAGELERSKSRLLNRVDGEVEYRLWRSLHNYITLDKEQDPDQVQPDYVIELKTGTKPESRLDIVEVFDRKEIGGKLLILGKPGSGKTTLLVNLAQELVRRAKEDYQQPIPVLLNLSSWKDDKQSIQDWLIEELDVKYRVNRDLGQNWLIKQLKLRYGVNRDLSQKLVEEQEIIPLLDGLDELASPRQLKCVEKINQFLDSGWDKSLVVCSRSEEHSLYKKKLKLKLNNSWELQPLTEKQVLKYLQDTGNSKLSEVIKGDAELQQLATTPLFLTIIVIVLSADEISWERWQELSSPKERRDYLFAAYIRRMLSRPYRGEKKPNDELTRRWLSWLAQRLIEENQTEFLIEIIQPYWLNYKWQKWIYGLINGLMGGLSVGMIGGLIYGLIENQIYGLIGGLIIGLIGGLIGGVIEGLIEVFKKRPIQVVETLQLSLDKIRKELIYGLMGGLTTGLIYGLIAGLTYGLIGGLIIGLIISLIRVLEGPEIESKTYPNQGIWNSLKNVATISLIIAPLVALGTVIILQWINQGVDATEALSPTWYHVLMVIPIVAFGVGAVTNGIPVMQHMNLRLVLWANGYAPWNYARFLDYATERLLMQRVGGRYRFIHDLLRQHLAKNP